MLTQHTGGPLGGQTYQHRCSEGSRRKHRCNTNFGGLDVSSARPTHRSCTPSSMMVGVAPVGRRNLFRTTSGPLGVHCFGKAPVEGAAVSLNYVVSQTQSDDSRKKDGQRLQPPHTAVASTAISGPPVAPSQDWQTGCPVTADDSVSCLFCHTSVA